MTWPAPISQHAPVRASDSDREGALERLRDHWIAGRLTIEEYEERCDEVHGSRYLHELAHAGRELPLPPPVARPLPPRSGSGAVTSLVLGITAIGLLAFSFGLLFLITLPMSVTAWTMGRSARRCTLDDRRQMALAGEIIGAVGTILAIGSLTACAMIFGAY